ncbi:homeobox domain-containing protein [Cohnella thailandensis]|uniref:Flagellar protein n=1 Tax=Cohnella thailandensis TaxID=557557 RepID=A0A841SVC9_9BACL|nr:homeobox domain-containing protein [Cohnella thailandensis]MBB6635212.1 flagellar protein [Cohnella thailandensis]MBP1974321.1 hypothetical protein [Cohnella thailandensis]
MPIGSVVAQCPSCGSLYQSTVSRSQCQDCAAREQDQLGILDRQLRRNRYLNNEQLSEQTSIPLRQIKAWIRNGRLKLYDYPNLSDSCDLCSGPIRSGKLCVSCSTRIQTAVAHEYEQDRLMKERTKSAHSYFSRRATSL